MTIAAIIEEVEALRAAGRNAAKRLSLRAAIRYLRLASGGTA